MDAVLSGAHQAQKMPVSLEKQYFLSGHIARSHGVDGTVLLVPVPEAAQPDFFENVELVRLQNERGDMMPVRIYSVKYQEKDSRISFFVKFEHIDNRNNTEVIIGSPVFVERKKIAKFLSENNSWISFEVLNSHNEAIGKVESVIQNPAHPIIEVSSKTGNILVPFVDEYVIDVNEVKKVIQCKNLNRLTIL